MRMLTRTVLLVGVMAAVLAAGTAFCKQSYDYIDITNPFLQKIPIAVPVFKSITPTDTEKKISENASTLLMNTLDFTGYFKVIDRSAYLEAPGTSPIIAPNIQFKHWTAIGAELLITGGVLVTNDTLEIELRLFDTFKKTLLIGKRYTGSVADERKIILRFCSEVIFQLTGQKGIFTSKIAFESTTTGNKEIYDCDFDGYDPQQLTHTHTITISPAWSSDGKWLAYTSYARGKPDLYIKNLAEDRGAVVAKPGINVGPAWVPDKFELAATLSFSGEYKIYLLTGGGKIIKKLTDNWGIDVSPSFSPDGKKMAFMSNRSGTQQIFIKNLETGQVQRLTYNGKQNVSPCWSPKGNKIAYASLQNGAFDIHVIGTDGSGDEQLTYNAGDNESPTWSPDGSLIAFSSTREGPSRIYVMTARGTDQRRLLTMKGQQTNPRWSPDMKN